MVVKTKMDRKRIAFGIGIMLAVLIAFTATAAADNVVYFDPDPCNATPNDEILVTLWVDTTDGLASFNTDVYFDPNVVNITNVVPGDLPTMWVFERRGVDWVRIGGISPDWMNLPSGHYVLGNFTLVGINSGTSTLHHEGNVLYDYGGIPLPDQVWHDGTFTCVGPPETFEEDLIGGWNLISLPLTPENNNTGTVLSSMSEKYDAVYRYDATSKEFEDVTTGTMDPGIGYFVNVTTAGTWSYEGTPPYNSMSIELKQGLNMIGWLNCTKQISGNLTSIAGKYNYNARWNAGYEVYEPHAPVVFNDFFDMKRGEGYWIAAKEDCTLTVSCSG